MLISSAASCRDTSFLALMDGAPPGAIHPAGASGRSNGDSGAPAGGTGGKNNAESGGAAGGAKVSEKGHGGDAAAETVSGSTSAPNCGSSHGAPVSASDAPAKSPAFGEHRPISGSEPCAVPKSGVPAAPRNKIPPKKQVIPPRPAPPVCTLFERTPRGLHGGAHAKMHLPHRPHLPMISCRRQRNCVTIRHLLRPRRSPLELQATDVVPRRQLLQLEGTAGEEASHRRGVPALSNLRKEKQSVHRHVLLDLHVRKDPCQRIRLMSAIRVLVICLT